MSLPLEFSIIIPVCNEEGNVGALIREVSEALQGRAYEIITVDDGSTDSTLTQLMQMKAEIPELRVIAHGENAGQSRAIRTGALAARGHILGTLDGDGQNDPADLPELYRILANAPDAQLGLVIGHRRDRQDTVWKKIGSTVGNRIRKLLLKDHCQDSACGIKVMPREVFLSLPYFDHMHRYMPALVRAEGLDYISHPVGHRKRAAGTSKYDNVGRAWVGLRDMRGVLWLAQRRRAKLSTREL
ncbi:MAG: glycosyltransferase family 2 protein [Hyphomonadaceae bacterium]